MRGRDRGVEPAPPGTLALQMWRRDWGCLRVPEGGGVYEGGVYSQ